MASVNIEDVVYKFLTGSNDATKGTTIQAAVDAGLSLSDVSTIVKVGAAKAANVANVVTTAATTSTPFGYTTQAQADSIVARINSILACLQGAGLMS